jgi:SOS-response transcriptional repressor LexA
MTPRQTLIYQFLLDYWFEHGRPATVREIGVAAGIVSPNGVMCHLHALVHKGYLERVELGADKRHAVYRPTAKEVLARAVPSGFLVGTVGGAVRMTRREYRAWLKEQLAALDGTRA